MEIEVIAFLNKWQTLIWSFLWPFLAIIFSIIWFWIQSLLKKRLERIENHRLIEIEFTKIINYTNISIQYMEDFIQRTDKIIFTMKEYDSNLYSNHITNFPPIIEIDFDNSLSQIKTKSYYLHNQILHSHYVCKQYNHILHQFKEDFNNVIIRWQWMIDKIWPKEQVKWYSQNLTEFITMTGEVINSVKEKDIKLFMQVKTYNLKLMNNYFKTIRTYEWASFKYFKNKKTMEVFKTSWAIERINKVIKIEVDSELKKTL